MSEEKLVPKLRFIEETWSSEKLGNLCKITMGQSPSSKNYSKNSNDTILIQGNADLIRGKIVPRIYTSEITKLSYPGDIILTVRAPVGDLAINEFDSCIGRGVCSIKGNKFIYYYLESLKDKHVWERLSQGSTFESINSNDIKNLNLKIPSNSTQNHIINFLTAIDTKIELLQKKHSEYLRFKQYLMQNIFADKSAEKLRFNFIDDWDVVKLETLIEKGKAGGTPPSTNPDYYNGEIPFLSIKDMTEQGKYIVKTEKSITEEGLNNSSAWIIPKYSLLYSIYASIGLVSINLTEVSTSQAIYGIILKEGVSLEYMYYYLTYFKKNIHRYVETGTQGNLNAKLLKSFEIALPSVDEQEMIVNILSLVDKKIENMEKEVGKMNEFKKGLIQQMFI